MPLNDKGLALLKSFEGCSLTAYLDDRGIPTIGYGHIADVCLGTTITQDQADAFLRADTRWAERVIDNLVTIALTDNQLSALICFVYNIGSGNFSDSTMLKLLNNNQIDDAAQEFVKWDKVDGAVVAGLLRRREAERDLFLTP